jgi:phage terminase large subunit
MTQEARSEVELCIPTPRAFKPLLEPARYKGAYGGRASAKSHSFAGLWLEESLVERKDVLCLREIQKSLKFSVHKLLCSKIQQYNAGSYFEVQDAKITSVHKGVTIFEGMQDHTAESIKSFEAFDIAWFEEANRCSQVSLDMLRPTIRKPGSQMWFSWNPDLPSDPVDSFLRGKDPKNPQSPPHNAIVVPMSWRDNPFISDESLRDMEYDRRVDPEKYQHIWEGGYALNSSSRVFKRWRIEEFDVDPQWTLRQGADWGFSVDPSVLIQCAIVGRRLYVIAEAYMVGCEIVDLPNLFDQVTESRAWWTVADSSRPETISHMQKHWSKKIGAAIKGARSLEEGVEFLQSFEIVVHPKCRHTIDELTAYSYKLDPLTQQVLPILSDKDNHVIDALRYACEGARRAQRQQERDKQSRGVHVVETAWPMAKMRPGA